jgi:hypothetical protein
MDDTIKSLRMKYQKPDNPEVELSRKGTPPEMDDDPKKANVKWLLDNDPRMAIYMNGKDDQNRPMIAYLVDGAGIRSNLWQDFVDGGNHGRYPWIPFNEYWLDIANAFVVEYDYNLIHETVEDRWMQKGLNYEEAHTKYANRAEYDARHVDHIHSDNMLKDLGWIIAYPEYGSGLKT